MDIENGNFVAVVSVQRSGFRNVFQQLTLGHTFPCYSASSSRVMAPLGVQNMRALIQKLRSSQVRIVHEELTLGHTFPVQASYEYTARRSNTNNPISLRNVRDIINETPRRQTQ